jgi:hypothetical protein
MTHLVRHPFIIEISDGGDNLKGQSGNYDSTLLERMHVTRILYESFSSASKEQ